MLRAANFKKQLIYLLIAILAIVILHLLFQYNSKAVFIYQQYAFLPLQRIRCIWFNLFPFSVGDIFYLVTVVLLLISIVRFFIKFFHSKQKKQLAFLALLRSVRFILSFYLLLFMLWGGNYFQAPLTDSLAFKNESEITKSDLIAFDELLVKRLNTCAANYKKISEADINRQAMSLYRSGNVSVKVQVKNSLFGNTMAYLGVEGYFNPFTGEAQINGNTPAFMQPFVITHEMAHQVGIAAEDDANLMAYIRCVQSGDTSFCYAAYLNIWLYTHRSVRMMDSAAARKIRAQLNQLTINHIDTLRQLRRKYDSRAGDYSSNIYDAYLKLGNQKEGIESYRNVAFTALAWERKYGQLNKENRDH